MNRTGKVQTVLDLIEPEKMGLTLTHEHILMDMTCRFEELPAELAHLAHLPVEPRYRADLIYYAFSNYANMRLDEVDVAIDEVALFKRSGGGTIIDCTTLGLGRNPEGLRRISEATGVHISMGAGYYAYLCHPEDVSGLSEDAIYEGIVDDIDTGSRNKGIKCGHIGEIGCENLTPDELKVLRAAARAQRSTGAMLNVHQIPGRPSRDDQTHKHRIADEIEAAGGDLRRTVYSHMDRTGNDFDYQISLLKRGITIEYDVFGYETCHSDWLHEPVQDVTRIRDLRRLADAGWIDQLVIAHDVCFKTMLTRYGGPGYSHIPTRIVEGFRAMGFSQMEIDTILVANPQRLLTFVEAAG
jgi:phosphotriesterase-related protein